MATWAAFYVNTSNVEAVTEKIRTLTGIQNAIVAAFPEDIGDYYQLNNKISYPDYLSVGKNQHDWVTIVHNSLDKIPGWGEKISNDLRTKVIITLAQSVSESYYFALYNNGEKIREIETCYSEDFEMIDYGKKFEFESRQTGSKIEYDGEEEYIFGFEEMEDYCKNLGLTIQNDYGDTSNWIVFKSNKRAKTVKDFVNELSKKKWWQFWK